MPAGDGAQCWRLCEFRDHHPGVAIGTVLGGAWQAFWCVGRRWIIVTRYTLRDLLDELEQRLGP